MLLLTLLYDFSHFSTHYTLTVHPTLVLHHSTVPKKVGIYQKSVKHNNITTRNNGLNVLVSIQSYITLQYSFSVTIFSLI
jgi:hypothetical protein